MSPKQLESVAAIARQIVSGEPQIEEAIDLVDAALPKDRALDAELRRHGIREIVYDVRHRMRQTLMVSAQPTTRGAEAQEACGDVYATSLLDHDYIGNKPIGECTRPEIVEEADREAGTAAGHRMRAQYLRIVAKMLRDDETPLRDATTDKRMENARAKVYGTDETPLSEAAGG